MIFNSIENAFVFWLISVLIAMIVGFIFAYATFIWKHNDILDHMYQVGFENGQKKALWKGDN